MSKETGFRLQASGFRLHAPGFRKDGEGGAIRVLLVVSRLQRGGLEQVLLDTALGLAGRVEFRVMALMGAGERDEDFRRVGIDVETLGGEATLSPRAWVANGRCFAALARSIRRWRPHVVQTHHFASGLVGRLAGLAAGGPRLLQAEHNFYRWKGGAARIVDRSMARFTDGFVAPSRAVAEHVMATHGAAADRVHVVPNGLTPGPWESPSEARQRLDLPQNGGPVIGFAGRLVRTKGPELFMALAHRLATAFPEATFLMAGDGPLRRSCEAAAEGLGERFRFAGSVPQLARSMRAFDLFCSCSTEEGFGLAAAEAVAAGVPAVLPDLPAFREVLPWREAGEFPPPDDLSALTAACEAVLGDLPAARDKAAWERERLLPSLDLSTMARRYEALYSGLLGAGRLAGPQEKLLEPVAVDPVLEGFPAVDEHDRDLGTIESR